MLDTNTHDPTTPFDFARIAAHEYWSDWAYDDTDTCTVIDFPHGEVEIVPCREGAYITVTDDDGYKRAGETVIARNWRTIGKTIDELAGMYSLA
jgi:hypothetical protein